MFVIKKIFKDCSFIYVEFFWLIKLILKLFLFSMVFEMLREKSGIINKFIIEK